MKRLLLILSLAALGLSACGGGGGSGSASGGGSPDAFCDLARQYEEDFEDTGSATTPAEAKTQFEELMAAVERLVAEAPDEIAEDVELVGDEFQKYVDLLAKYDYDFSKVPDEEAEQIDIDDPDVTAASNRIESYFETECDIDSDGDGDTDGQIEDETPPPTGGEAPLDEEEQAPADETATTGQ
jgi:hypothetical protein